MNFEPKADDDKEVESKISGGHRRIDKLWVKTQKNPTICIRFRLIPFPSILIWALIAKAFQLLIHPPFDNIYT